MEVSTNMIMYGLLILGASFVWYIEKKDIECPTLTSTAVECRDEGGMSFSYTKPKGTDTCQELIKKIEKAAGAEQSSIKWRRSLILSVFVMIVMWILVGTPGKL